MGFVLLIIFFVILIVKYYPLENATPVVDTYNEANTSSSIKRVDVPLDSVSLSSSTISSASSSFLTKNTPSSLATSSPNSLSGTRVNAAPEIANFLRQMDSVVIPTLYLPTPSRDLNFDDKNAKPEELSNKAQQGDPYAAYSYADYIVKNGVRTVTDSGAYAYTLDSKKRIAAMNEAREFYIRALRGGIKSAADVLSRLYASSLRGGNRVESLAWRKISFAIGESERYDCLRNSEICVVKDFNNLNRLEFFYPCLSSAGESCTQDDYDKALRLALMYADSLEYAMNNTVPQ